MEKVGNASITHYCYCHPQHNRLKVDDRRPRLSSSSSLVVVPLLPICSYLLGCAPLSLCEFPVVESVMDDFLWKFGGTDNYNSLLKIIFLCFSFERFPLAYFGANFVSKYYFYRLNPLVDDSRSLCN